MSITVAPVKRIQTTCMLKPKAHPHLCDNSEQHESKGGNAYAFLFVVLLVLFGGTCPCHTRPLCDPLGHLAPQVSTWVTRLFDSGGNRTKLKLARGCIEPLQKVLSISRMHYIESEKYAAACGAHLATYRIH